MVFTLMEIVDIAAMVLVVGYIFSDFFKKYNTKFEGGDDIIEMYRKRSFFDWENIKFAALLTAPAIILHEFGHKFIAMAFGLDATFHAAYMWLGIALLLKLLNTGFVFFVPAYVSISSGGTYLQYAATAAAGPLVNGSLWLLSLAAVKFNWIPKKYQPMALMSAKINVFLMIFNLIPFPGFDGFQVALNLLRAFA